MKKNFACLVVLGLAELVALIGPGKAVGAQKLALIVGVNKYDHENLKPLRFAVRDASELGRVLQGRPGFQVTLISDDTATKPTKANISGQIKAVLEKCQKGDTAILAFAGHGCQFEGGDAFFCPSDGRPFPDRKDSLVSLSEIYKQLEQSFAGVRVLLVDACRDDPTASRGLNADNTPRPPKGVAALFSCSAGERAFEDASLLHGVFFHHVLRGLEGDAKDKDGDVTFEGLSAYVRKRVSRQVPDLIGGGAKQSPNLKADLSGESPILVSGLGATPSVPIGPAMTMMEFIAFKKIKLTRRSDRPDPLGIIEIHFPSATNNDDLARIFGELPMLSGLITLDLGDTKITDAGLAGIANHRGIKNVILSDTAISGDGLKHLAGLAALESLDLGGTAIDDAGLKALGNLGILKRLVLADTAVTDAGISSLQAVSELEFLDLGRTKISGAGVDAAARFPQLKRLRVPGTKVSPAELTELRKRHSKLTIE